MPELLNIEVQLEPRVRNISVDVESQLQDIEVGICSSFIYAFSPTAKVEELPNGNYLITITDKYGTTTAEVPVVDSETINEYIENYLQNNPIIIQQLIKEAEDYQELYNELKELIQNAIDVSVPAEPDGSININGTNYQVYELPEQVVTTDDFLIIDCLDARAESSGESGESIPQQATDRVGNGIEDVIFNNDYTLTISFTDGTSYTTPVIRGAKGDAGDVSDVIINGTSVVNQGVASIPVASPSTYGVTKGGRIFVSGTTPSITAQDGVQYICGEVATLDIILPDSGIVDVVFTSGATATVLTITPPTGQTVRWANGFDPTSLEANTTYEVNFLNGMGVVGLWT